MSAEMMAPHTPGIRIEDIVIGTRARKNLGDVHDLVQSIADLGLLHPIVITKDRRLIAGHRRLEACARLGWEAIPATVAEHLTDAVDLLRAERDENTCRKDMTMSELLELGRAIEALERPKAAKRKAATQLAGRAPDGSPIGPVPAYHAEAEPVRVRDAAADATGMSTATYSRMKQIQIAATNPDLPDADRIRAQDAMAIIDRIVSGEEIRLPDGGRPLTITRVYENWRGRPLNQRQEEDERIEDPIQLHRRRPPTRRQAEAITSGISGLRGLCHGFESVTEIDPSTDTEEVARWERDLSEVLRVLRSFHHKLKEHVHGSRN